MTGIFTIKLLVTTPDARVALTTIYTERDIAEDDARESFMRWVQQNPALAENARGEWTARVVF